MLLTIRQRELLNAAFEVCFSNFLGLKNHTKNLYGAHVNE